MTASSYVELDLEVIHMTADAIYLSDGDGAEDWVPNSLIRDGRELNWDDVGKTLTLELEEWIAIKKGFV